MFLQHGGPQWFSRMRIRLNHWGPPCWRKIRWRRSESRGIEPRRVRQHSFMEINHEVLCTVLLSRPLIQGGQLSVFWGRKNVQTCLTALRAKPAQLKCVKVNWLPRHDLKSVDSAVKLQLNSKTQHEHNNFTFMETRKAVPWRNPHLQIFYLIFIYLFIYFYWTGLVL